MVLREGLAWGAGDARDEEGGEEGAVFCGEGVVGGGEGAEEGVGEGFVGTCWCEGEEEGEERGG